MNKKRKCFRWRVVPRLIPSIACTKCARKFGIFSNGCVSVESVHRGGKLTSSRVWSWLKSLSVCQLRLSVGDSVVFPHSPSYVFVAVVLICG